MNEPILPLSQEELYRFIVNSIAPSPQEIYARMLTNFSDENQSIINSPGNPFGTMLLSYSTSLSAALAKCVELNSNLLWTDSSGEQLKKNLYNFGTKMIPATSTVVRIGFDISGQVTIAANTIFIDELDVEFRPISPFTSNAATGEIDLYSVEIGQIAPRGSLTPKSPISAISNIATIKTTLGRQEEGDLSVKERLENSEGANIFGTTTYVQTQLLNQVDYISQAKVTQNNTNSQKEVQDIDVDANSIIAIVRPLVSEADSISAIGSTIYNSVKGGQKISQPPITDIPNGYRGVSISSGYVDEAALNAAGYVTDANSQWAVWSPDKFAGIVNIPFIYAQPQEIEIEYKVTFNETISLEQRNALINQLKKISLEQTPVFSQTFSRIKITQYDNAIAESIVDNTITIDEIFLSVVGDNNQQDQQSVISSLNRYLFLPGQIVDGTAITSNVTITETSP